LNQIQGIISAKKKNNLESLVDPRFTLIGFAVMAIIRLEDDGFIFLRSEAI